MVFNGAPARRAKVAGKFYRRLDSCLVIPPPLERKPRAIIKFLGGAFVGAVTEATYGNGALLQLLVGSYYLEKIQEANAVVSFNNKPASEAVLYFEQECYGFVFSGDAWKALLDTAGTLIQECDQEAMASLTKFVDQVPSVMNEVTQGTSEFKPAPPENREFFKKPYTGPHTLLVKFSTDAIDETDLLEDILRPRVESIGGTLEKGVKCQVGYQYTPADALAQGLKALSLNDTRVLARTTADWFKGLKKAMICDNLLCNCITTSLYRNAADMILKKSSGLDKTENLIQPR